MRQWITMVSIIESTDTVKCICRLCASMKAMQVFTLGALCHLPSHYTCQASYNTIILHVENYHYHVIIITSYLTLIKLKLKVSKKVFCILKFCFHLKSMQLLSIFTSFFYIIIL